MFLGFVSPIGLQIYPPHLTQVPNDGYIYLEDAYILEIVRI